MEEELEEEERSLEFFMNTPNLLEISIDFEESSITTRMVKEDSFFSIKKKIEKKR